MKDFVTHAQRLDLGSALIKAHNAAVEAGTGRRPIELQPRNRKAGHPALLKDLKKAFERFEIGDGATLSFHHHFRNGDRILASVVGCAAELGLRDLKIAASSIFPVHASIVPHIRSGVVGSIVTDYMSGPVADAVTAGELGGTALFQSHGGRARALSSGELTVDVAFVGASRADMTGAATGREGPVPCGPLGYAMVDAAYARKVVVLAQEIADEPVCKVDIPASQVDALLHFPNPGLPSGITFGSTIPLNTPESNLIGRHVANVIRAAGLFHKGFSFQTGAGGFSLGCVPHIQDALSQAEFSGDFVSGGITGAHVEIARGSHVRCIKDVQCFDRTAVLSSMTNDFHLPMSAAQYASPIHPQAVVNDLSVMILGAAEIDRDFNINVVAGGNGKIIGGPGGHPDTARGADLTIATSRLTGGGYAKLVDQVTCIATPGRDVDVLVTDEGIAVNPANETLTLALGDAGIPVVPIEELVERSQCTATKFQRQNDGAPCALIETPDGQITDVILGER